jgi:uncharacterized protein (TIGR00369 family)
VRTRLEAYLAGDFKIPANDAFGFEMTPAADPKDSVTATWVVADEYCNSAGNLQGGVLAAFVDAAMGSACAAHMTEDLYPALAEMKISFLRPAKAGTKIHATARVIKPGKRLMFVEADVNDDEGNLLARISGTEVPAPLPKS